MKVSELEGERLDKLVAKAEGEPTHCFVRPYSSEWHVGGPIIERERMRIQPVESAKDRFWHAEIWGPYAEGKGPTPLIAAMRAYCASRFGEEVPNQESQ